MIRTISFLLKLCLVEWILGRMKKKGENEKEKLFGGCLVGGEGKDDGTQVFSTQTHQNREKTQGGAGE